MPFTAAHPAAALPLGRLHRRIDPVALVVGSAMPDLPYMVLAGPAREMTHTLGATLWYCLPTGVAVYFVVRLFFLEAWHALLPRALRSRIGRPARGWRALHEADATGVLAGLWLGALTHFAWDSFTHWTSPVVQGWPALQEIVVAVGDQRMSVFNLLQHGSTVVGFLALALWATEWFQGATESRPALERRLGWRRALLGLWLTLPALLAGGAFLLRFRAQGFSLVGFTTGAAAAGFVLLPAATFTSVGVGLLWILVSAPERRRA